jgi:hypothetical protein
VQGGVAQLRVDLVHEAAALGRYGKIARHVMDPIRIAALLGRHVLARTGEDAPPRAEETRHGRAADAARRAGQDEGSPLRHGRRLHAFNAPTPP